MAQKGFRYRLLLHKSYFDKGLGLTNYAKYLIAFFALASQDIKNTLIFTLIYCVVCYFLGMTWYKTGWTIIETEVGNDYNLFVIEMRNKKRKNRKI